MKATKFKSEQIKVVFSVSSRIDRMGKIYFYVDYQDDTMTSRYCRFENMSSVMDFVKSNF